MFCSHSWTLWSVCKYSDTVNTGWRVHTVKGPGCVSVCRSGPSTPPCPSPCSVWAACRRAVWASCCRRPWTDQQQRRWRSWAARGSAACWRARWGAAGCSCLFLQPQPTNTTTIKSHKTRRFSLTDCVFSLIALFPLCLQPLLYEDESCASTHKWSRRPRLHRSEPQTVPLVNGFWAVVRCRKRRRRQLTS